MTSSATPQPSTPFEKNTKINVSKKFEAFMAAYPRRDGEKPRLPVLNAFKAAIKAGADVEQMVGAARCCASSHATRKIVGTKFIPAAARRLEAERWRDHAPTMSTNPIDLKEPRRLQALEKSRAHLG